MNVKMIFISGLLFTVLAGLLSFGFLSYTLYNDPSKLGGDKMVTSHQMLFYIQLVTHLLALGFAVGVFYKR